MDVYKTEDEQWEAVRQWWRENGMSAVFGIVLGLGAIFGWRWWQTHQIEQAEAASGIYQTALIAASQGNHAEATQSAREIIANYGGTGYAVFARMIIAYAAVQERDYATAAEQLSAALEEADNPSIAHEIRLRLARVHIAAGNPQQAIDRLNVEPQGAFASRYSEIRGDAHAAQGNATAARESYQQAIATALPSADTSLLNLKLDSLDTE